jgi:hypothetical protein
MRDIFVPHTGQAPWAALLPFFIVTTSPENSRFSRHFTQYPSYEAMLDLLSLVGGLEAFSPVSGVDGPIFRN